MRVLVAGVGNVFFGDDGFGPEVARALLVQEPVAGAKIEDFGIRGLHLAYELLNGYEHAIIVDAVPRGDVPGTLYVIEPDAMVLPATPDAHSMDLGNVFAYLRTLGGEPPPLTIVGCEPESIEPGMGLSPAVARSVDGAAALVRRLIDQQHSQVRVATQQLAAQGRQTTGGST
ncbi:MAG TPA: hydrogenase maturation protease [Candidatus Elarobacter sp.]|nr:hydrogenase maturation protease [Candidatus Elarobacter sp.]HEV2738911.1 hydrogenase maturation protease [Candidatus Elarobacter sp.]